MKKILLILGLLMFSIQAKAQSVEETFNRCIDKAPTECGLFKNKYIGRRIAAMIGDDERFTSICRSFEEQASSIKTCTTETWINKYQCYVELMMWGRNTLGEKTILYIQYNTTTKKINIYWKEGREWQIKHEDSYIPDKLLFLSRKFR